MTTTPRQTSLSLLVSLVAIGAFLTGMYTTRLMAAAKDQDPDRIFPAVMVFAWLMITVSAGMRANFLYGHKEKRELQ